MKKAPPKPAIKTPITATGTSIEAVESLEPELPPPCFIVPATVISSCCQSSPISSLGPPGGVTENGSILALSFTSPSYPVGTDQP